MATYIDSDYLKYKFENPEAYRFVTGCSLAEAFKLMQDAATPDWARKILTSRFSKEFDEQAKVDKALADDRRKYIAQHPNADICIVKLALAIYGENDKRATYDKISLGKALDEAFKLYENQFPKGESE